MLALLLLLAFVAPPQERLREVSPCGRYFLHLEQAGVPENYPLPTIRADFDNDGVDDIITPSTTFFYFYMLTVRSGATGALLLTASSGSDGFNGYSIVSFNADGSYPSIVFASYRYDPNVPTGFAPTAQKIAINNAGVFTILTLPVSLVGRDVSCTRNFPGRTNPVCFFASYYDYGQGAGTSKLIEVRPDGTALDITQSAGLPFPASEPNGRFMIGASWTDFSGDGLPDLVAVGQHSQILAATTTASGTFAVKWVGPALDYMRAFHYAYADLLPPDRPPCVYLAIEPNTAGPDRLICYDRAALGWYDPAAYSPRLPPQWSYTRPVRLWRWANQQPVFAASDGIGGLNLYSLTCP